MDIYSASYSVAQRITPNDTTTYTWIRGLIVDAVGTLAVVDPGGNAITYAAVVVGQFIPHAVSIVKTTGTTAAVVAVG